MTTETTPSIPTEASLSGRNAHTFWCGRLERQTHYAACLNILGRLDDGASDEGIEDCHRADNCGECPARSMRKEEITAGKALYFKERIFIEPVSRPKKVESEDDLRQVDKGSVSYLRGRFGADSKEYREAAGNNTPPKPQKKAQEVLELDAAKVVTELATAAPTKPEVDAKSEPAVLRPMPGESPLAFAKRRKQAMKVAA